MKFFTPISVSSLPRPWSDLVAGWLDAFGLDEAQLHVGTASIRRGTVLHLHGETFLLDTDAPGMLQELQHLALHLERIEEAFRRDDMIRLSGRAGLPPAWSFIVPALAPAVIAASGISNDEFLATLAESRRQVRGRGHTRWMRSLDGLGIRARAEGERLRLDCHLGGEVWFVDLSRGRLELPMALPETAMTALARRSVPDVVEHRALLAVAGPIRKVEARTGRTVIDFDMPLRLLAEPPVHYLGWPGTAAPDAHRATPPWRSDGRVRRLLFRQARTLLAVGDGGERG